jgi:heme-degrading monooxygenase HmoA
MLVIVWRFAPASGRESEFRQAYGPDGAWARLFSRAPGYLGTELLRERGSSDGWLTIDRWRSALEHETFERRHADEYAALDARCVALTSREERIGEFEVEGPVQAAS